MAALHPMNCRKKQLLAQQSAQWGPCPASLVSTGWFCEESPKARLAWCDTPAALGLPELWGTSESGRFQLKGLCVVV